MEMVRSFKKVNRSYHSTPDGWRLATFEEALNGLESNMVQQHLGEWESARLLDGWISGAGYDYEIGQEFRSCMGYMLLIQTQTSAQNASGTPYADVNLSELGKEVALFLCVDDWNFEVVYWLLNSWSNSMTMNLAHVRGGKLPFVNAADFQKMNEVIARLAISLAEEEVAAREKARTTKYSGTDSVRKVLKGMIQLIKEEEQLTGYNMWNFIISGVQRYDLPESVQTGDVAGVFWSFVSDTFADHVVETCSFLSLKNISLMKTNRTSEKNLMIATSILLYLSAYRSDIIHEPLPHRCKGNCGGNILSYAEKEADGDPENFREMLKHNAMWRCYDETGSYGVLNKLLFSVAKGQYNYTQGKRIAVTVRMLLQCGAQPAGCHAIGKYRKKTALHNAAKFPDEDVSKEVGQALLGSCDEESRYDFVNAADERGRTALHRASEKGNASLCELLVEFKTSLNAQDKEGMTPLHYALEGRGMDEVINVLIQSPKVTESLDLKDKRGRTPLDIAIANNNYPSTAKLLSKSKDPEAYFSKVSHEQLLRYSLLVGSTEIVQKLYVKDTELPAGNCDEDGKTALHLAAMRDDEDSANQIIGIILDRLKPETQEQIVKMVAECDRRGRTVLHEAALNGHDKLCGFLLGITPELLYMKDRDRRSPLYDLAKGKYKGTSLTTQWLNAWMKKDMHMEDLIDRNGLTPLHVAVSQGKVKVVETLLSSDKFREKYLSRGDFLAQTALHKAAKRGDRDTVEVLLKHGAHPLKERDYDGRTALHYAVQAETGDREKLAEALFTRCESEKEKSLLLWASAAGLGTADQNLRDNDLLRKVLIEKKSQTKEINLLRTAASVGNIEMMKELIIKGYEIGDILNSDWRSGLDKASQVNVTRVSKQIDMIKEQGNDKPAKSDSLGRLDYAQGLAALFLNPYMEPPIAVGITGTWGMGKSSLMFQTEQILLTTAAQMALLESSKLRSLALELPGIKSYKLSSNGRSKCENIYKQIKYGESTNRNLNKEKIQEELEKFLNEYDRKYRKVFKSLAAMDSSDMFETNDPRPKADSSAKENVPAVLTVQYNAWKYRNDTEALAGMAVEITKELEGVMSQAQWFSTCCRNTWKKKKYTLWIEIFFPSLLALVLVSSLTWIAWVVFDSDKFKQWAKAKYAWPPAAMIIIVWTLTKSVMSILKPVSTQLMQYVSFPDHSDKLGYQERVISDITFLKAEIGKKAYWVFIVFGWLFTAFTWLWHLITESWATSMLFHRRDLEKAIDAPKLTAASGRNLRIIVFVDDLDRCQESVILQVLSAINIVLAECEISVVMGMDKRLIERAIMKKYGDGKTNRSLKASQELADMYLQKIIQLPLDLPDPSEEQSRRFLKGQLSVLENEDEVPHSGDEESPGNEKSDDGVSSQCDRETEVEQQNVAAAEPGDEESDCGGSISSDGEGEAEQQNAPPQVSINMPSSSEKAETGAIEHTDDRSSSRGDGEINVQSVSEKKCLKFLKFPVRNIVHALQALRKAKTETGPTNLPEPIEPTDDRDSSMGDREINVQSALEKKCLKFLKFAARNIVHSLQALWKAKIETETVEPSETGRQDPSQTEEDKLSHKHTSIRQNPNSSILIREMLFVRYSQGEENAFFYFQGLATDSRKLPREWKRLLNYHRLVWYILSLSKEAKNVAGWQVQLITWIFVCWEWQENMNLVIEKWKEIKWKDISGLKTSESNEPSLLMIVEHLMEEHERENQKMTATGKEEDGPKRTEGLGEAGGSVSKLKDKEGIESRNTQLEKLNEKGAGKILEITDGEGYIARSTDDSEKMEKGTSQKLVKDVDKLDALEKSLAELKKEVKKIKDPASDELKEEMKELIKQVSDELKEEMKELKKQMSDQLKELKKHMSDEFKGEMKELKKESDELKEEMKELKKQVSDELRKDINEIKEQMAKKNGQKQPNMENKRIKLHNLESWQRMKSTLERYDVSMDGIQAFQRFRFYCIAGYLPRPPLKER
ncbi:hypothetical protein SUGI_0778660 [Cryptomeria japonica]|uniref:uncharacterized protein LOC131063478 n=1 Tax=Cryptomeria japonica TaxID=3369 RepID=UPI002414B41D|nr:uncharacterized protein LOC131063478 [Cryptomeria japonica]XP_059063786.1 uncharacterized protein LOC131063478 [Cryptomeria japonica]GLJ38248.1 hypothetical protein SUGI_0778660 [Cryptomeria japonica]